MGEFVDFYHYTSSSGKDCIERCGYINTAGGNHTHFGVGVYGTSLPTWRGKEKIALNNWTWQFGPLYVRRGLCDWAFHIRIPADKVKRVSTGYRDILLYSERLELKDFTYTTIEVTAE